ncbi:MAG: CDP-alcohol phosphatidyltransferase family protein [Bacteroidetes bacterium]|nr:CDP-alcohol phosphatidyltransferase family protein [Bacteroidota bacterium]MCW5896886.1 CDP-alcohol phosphatidyltransferase family protein [Bacteroidota bacterium]
MTIAEEYRKSLKMAEAEEILDLMLYRPIAFILVKLIYRLPITPNQVTYAALIAGLIAAFEFGQGTANGFIWGAIWYAIANVLDCGDGMLARLQKSGTPLGRIVDGIVDWVSSVAIFFGLGLGLSAYYGQPLLWLLAFAAGMLSGYHAMMFDKRQQEYISTVRGERNFIDRESEKINAELNITTNPVRRLFLSAYRWYLTVQEGSRERHVELPHYPPQLYRSYNKSIMRWWTFLGPTTNRSLLMIAGLLTAPEWFCWAVIVPMNLYLVFLTLWQREVTRKLNTAVKSNLFATPVAA